MKDKYVVHTGLKTGLELVYDMWSNENIWITRRFQEDLEADLNTNRISIVGIPDEVNNTMSVGLAFASYPQNFSRFLGSHYATLRAESYQNKYKPYAVIRFNDVITQEACLQELYDIHDSLINLSVKEVKRLVNQQIVK